MKNFLRNILAPLSFFCFSLTQVSAGVSDAVSSTDKVYGNVLIYLFNPILQFFTVIAFLYFLYGVFKYILAMSGSGTNDEINNGKSHLFWGLVGLFIIISISGIISFISSILSGFFN